MILVFEWLWRLFTEFVNIVEFECVYCANWVYSNEFNHKCIYFEP